MGVLIKNGEIVTATDRMKADLSIKNGKIVAMGQNLDLRHGDHLIDASGALVFPGGIDVHTHLDMPFMGSFSTDDFESGTVAAAFGGTTGVIDFVMPGRAQSMREALEIWHQKAKGKAVIDYAFHMAITRYDDAIASEMADIVAQGVTSFKAFMAYKGSIGIDDEALFKAMRRTRELGALLSVHAEHADVINVLVADMLAQGKTHPRYHALSRPAACEAEATHRAIALAKLAERSLYVVHLSTEEGLHHIQRAQQEGYQVLAETCPQYLLLDDSRYDEPEFGGAKYVMSPPLRKPSDNEALWHGLANGSVQIVATDHCPFNFGTEKSRGRDNFAMIPNGAPGIENRMALLYTYGVATGRISLNRFVEVFATNPAKQFGLHPRKGTIAIGADADLVVFDPTVRGRISAKTHHQRVDYNPFEGFETIGAPTHVLVNGQIVVEGDSFVGEPGGGRYLARQPILNSAKEHLIATP